MKFKFETYIYTCIQAPVSGAGRGKVKSSTPRGRTLSSNSSSGNLNVLDINGSGADGGHGRLDWKARLLVYIRVPLSEAVRAGLMQHVQHDQANHRWLLQTLASNEQGVFSEEGADGADEMKETIDEADIGGEQFIEAPVLYACYSYVTAAAKVYEESMTRKATTQAKGQKQRQSVASPAPPEFEQVYLLVIDAVISYNEQWEIEMNRQIQEAAATEQVGFGLSGRFWSTLPLSLSLGFIVRPSPHRI